MNLYIASLRTNSHLTQATIHSTKSQTTMETSHLPGKSFCIWLLLGQLTIIACLPSFADAETHYHEFVVSVLLMIIICGVSHCCMKLVTKHHDYNIGETGSIYASEEAVQNPQHTHSKWAISRTNRGSQKWRLSWN